jgi:hypothetical protein
MAVMVTLLGLEFFCTWLAAFGLLLRSVSDRGGRLTISLALAFTALAALMLAALRILLT